MAAGVCGTFPSAADVAEVGSERAWSTLAAPHWLGSLLLWKARRAAGNRDHIDA